MVGELNRIYVAAAKEARRQAAAALVTLELAVLYARGGKMDLVRRLAASLYTVFKAQDVTRETLVALGLFQAAATNGSLTVQLVTALCEFVRRARGNPDLVWKPPKVAG